MFDVNRIDRWMDRRRAQGMISIFFLLFGLIAVFPEADAMNTVERPHVFSRHVVIPVLGTTLNDRREQIGVVADVYVSFIRRDDRHGLNIRFDVFPGQFSRRAQHAVTTAVRLVAERAGLDPRSWSVRFTLPYEGVTLYGESLSAMAALAVIALAKNEAIRRDTVITGTVMPNGTIGVVGGVPLKIAAAHRRHFRRVLIPEEQDVADGDWRTPFLMQISPMHSIADAYFALTDHPFSSSALHTQLAATLAP
ncbi:MAG: hypothetical protein D6690_03000 [Nitrospirae bacterium]|nr:MAG: hypothetical protein D6690_03000 [Nitrospirota bacterium]